MKNSSSLDSPVLKIMSGHRGFFLHKHNHVGTFHSAVNNRLCKPQNQQRDKSSSYFPKLYSHYSWSYRINSMCNKHSKLISWNSEFWWNITQRLTAVLNLPWKKPSPVSQTGLPPVSARSNSISPPTLLSPFFLPLPLLFIYFTRRKQHRVLVSLYFYVIKQNVTL